MSCNHYDYIEKHGKAFSDRLRVEDVSKLLSAHGDKSEQYKRTIEEAGYPFHKGAMVCLLTYVKPYSDAVRQTETGWVSVRDWLFATLKHNPIIRGALASLPD